MKYEYQTIAIHRESDIRILERLYADGWEYLHAVAQHSGQITGPIYFTLRKPIHELA